MIKCAYSPFFIALCKSCPSLFHQHVPVSSSVFPEETKAALRLDLDHLLGNHWTEGSKLKERRLLEMASVALCKPFWDAQSSAEMQKSVMTD